MPLIRFQVAASYDSVLPRDTLVNTLHFNDQGVTSDPDQLCEDLADIFLGGWYANNPQVVVTAYDVGPPPQYPIGRYETNTGVSPSSTCPREVSLCLSYYAERNIARRRGRIFLPFCATSYSASVRPAVERMQQALDLATDLSGLGGIDVDWQLYSPTDGAAFNVTNAWVDDEWDTIRSRGLRGVERLTVAVDES